MMGPSLIEALRFAAALRIEIEAMPDSVERAAALAELSLRELKLAILKAQATVTK